MGIDTSRRWFLIGSGAAIAAAITPAFSQVVAMPVTVHFRVRRIWHIGVFPRYWPGDDIGRAGHVALRCRGKEFFSEIIAPGLASYGCPLAEIVVLPNDLVEVALEPHYDCNIVLLSTDTLDDGTCVDRMEHHTFMNGDRSVRITDIYQPFMS